MYLKHDDPSQLPTAGFRIPSARPADLACHSHGLPRRKAIPAGTGIGMKKHRRTDLVQFFSH